MSSFIIEAHKYRNKPVFVEAIQYINKGWQYDFDVENRKRFIDFLNGFKSYFGDNGELFIQLPKSVLIVEPGDFVVKTDFGIITAMKADTFLKMYERVE